MGLVKKLVNGNESKKYAELTDADLKGSPESTSIVFADIKSQDDLINAREKLHDDNILFLDISYIESNGLSINVVYNEMGEAVESVGGDIVHKKRNDMIIATPRDIGISREKL